MTTPRFATVDDYLASLDPVKAQTIRGIIDLILSEFPDTSTAIAWNVPQIKRGKEYVFGFYAAKKHISLNPWSTQVIDAYRPQLEPTYIVEQSLFKVPVDWQIDRDLITGMVRARLAELDAA